MSILIKGVDIPKCCDKCNIKHLIKCKTYIGYHHKDTNRANKCPIVEVQTPHGDLIDIDTIDFTNNDDTSKAFNMGAAWAIMQVARAKIVIDSEG